MTQIIVDTRYKCPACYQEYSEEVQAKACLQHDTDRVPQVAVGDKVEYEETRSQQYGGESTKVYRGTVVRVDRTNVFHPRILVELKDGERHWCLVQYHRGPHYTESKPYWIS